LNPKLANPFAAKSCELRVRGTSGTSLSRAAVLAVVIVRSILFNILFYLNLTLLLLAAVVTFVLPRRGILGMATIWGLTSMWLLRVVCGTKVEFRGLDKLPKGGAMIVAAKHQSTWETFALLWLFPDFTFIVKRELMWIPLFGWFMVKGRMIPVDRGAGSQALTDMTARARTEIRSGRQLVIFPEGTRRAPGAEPRYKFGVAHLYAEVGVPCVPIALNAGLFWPRRSFLRLPGTILVEVLDPIPPGADKEAFLKRLQDTIETATARLVAEGREELRRLSG
jgi:1-acyl-sn-glycerol-3-phosphate acyltransferase